MDPEKPLGRYSRIGAIRMTEKQQFWALLLLLICSIGLAVWLNHGYGLVLSGT